MYPSWNKLSGLDIHVKALHLRKAEQFPNRFTSPSICLLIGGVGGGLKMPKVRFLVNPRRRGHIPVKKDIEN